jgi:hypothetical protein
MVLLFAIQVPGQSNQYGLISIKAADNADGMDKEQTTSRLFIMGQTNEYRLPILRLIIADKPFMVGRLSLFEGTIINASNQMKAFKIPLATNQLPQARYAQIIDVPITNGPVTHMLAAMFNSLPSDTVAVDVVDEDDPKQSKSYIVPRSAIDELRRQYLLVITKNKGSETTNAPPKQEYRNRNLKFSHLHAPVSKSSMPHPSLYPCPAKVT